MITLTPGSKGDTTPILIILSRQCEDPCGLGEPPSYPAPIAPLTVSAAGHDRHICRLALHQNVLSPQVLILSLIT